MIELLILAVLVAALTPLMWSSHLALQEAEASLVAAAAHLDEAERNMREAEANTARARAVMSGSERP